MPSPNVATQAFGAWFVALVFACGPSAKPSTDAAERYATAACTSMLECGCVERFESDAVCKQILTERAQLLLDSGFDVDDECLSDALAVISDCSASVEEILDPGACVALRGNKRRGALCSQNRSLGGLRVNDCGSGLSCASATCVPDGEAGDPYPLRAPGETCKAAEPVSCGIGEVYCGRDGICHARAPLGEACNHPWGCTNLGDEGVLYCKGTGDAGEAGVCAVPEAVGAACDPRDWFACGLATCDLDTSACVDGTNVGPAICEAFDYPLTWPSLVP